MSDIAKKLRASVRFDAVNGDSFERGICAQQMNQAATEIERLRQRLAKLEGAFRHTHQDYPCGSDACVECGLDLRDPIHARAE